MCSELGTCRSPWAGCASQHLGCLHFFICAYWNCKVVRHEGWEDIKAKLACMLLWSIIVGKCFQISLMWSTVLLLQRICKAMGYSYNFPVWFSSSLMHHHSLTAYFQTQKGMSENTLIKKGSFWAEVGIVWGVAVCSPYWCSKCVS